MFHDIRYFQSRHTSEREERTINDLGFFLFRVLRDNQGKCEQPKQGKGFIDIRHLRLKIYIYGCLFTNGLNISLLPDEADHRPRIWL